MTIGIWPLFDAKRDREPGDDRRAGAVRRRWDADTTRVVVCYGVFGFGYIIPATFLPVMARRAIHDPSVFGWSWPIFGAAAAASTFAAAGLARSMGNQEGREIGGVKMIAAMASAFSVGQTAGPLLVSSVVRADGGFSEALAVASVLLIVSAWVVRC